MQKFTTHQAKTQLSHLIRLAQAGEDIVVCKGDEPVVRLVPVSNSTALPTRPRVGTITSAPVGIKDGAFDPLDPEELEAWGI